MLGDIKILEQASMTGRGATKYNVAAGATVINAGEPVARALGATTVTAAVTGTPVVGTDYYAGIAATTSTNTASLAGYVYVYPTDSGTTLTIKPKVAATWDTQAEYDALVGKRVLIDLTTGVYTLLAADGATFGCVVMPLDVSKYPGRIAIALRAATSDLS